MDFGTGGLQDVTRLIQLSIAPIFLLSAVATTLSVLINRLARVVDRGRSLESRSEPLDPQTVLELRRLERRAHMVYRAISCGVMSALTVCVLMTTAFVGEMMGVKTGAAVAVFFIAALIAYTAALLFLLQEVFLAIGGFHLGLGSQQPQ